MPKPTLLKKAAAQLRPFKWSTMFAIPLALGPLALGVRSWAEDYARENQPQTQSSKTVAAIAKEVPKGWPVDTLIADGERIAMGWQEPGSSGGNVRMACFSCHGIDGAGNGPSAFPAIGGMPVFYQVKQLKNYQSGTRVNPLMQGIAKSLTEREMYAVSAYYAQKVVIHKPSQTLAGLRQQRGAQLAAIGDAEHGIAACTNCHMPPSQGQSPTVPALAGQHASYIVTQLQAWRDGDRGNDAGGVMERISKAMSRSDMLAVGEYYSRRAPSTAANVDLLPKAPASTPVR